MRHFLDNQSLIDWLRSKNPNELYSYERADHCLLARYLKSRGFRGVTVIPYQYSIGDGDFKPLPLYWEEIAQGDSHGGHKSLYSNDRNFGAALKRAEHFLNENVAV